MQQSALKRRLHVCTSRSSFFDEPTLHIFHGWIVYALQMGRGASLSTVLVADGCEVVAERWRAVLCRTNGILSRINNPVLQQVYTKSWIDTVAHKHTSHGHNICNGITSLFSLQPSLLNSSSRELIRDRAISSLESGPLGPSFASKYRRRSCLQKISMTTMRINTSPYQLLVGRSQYQPRNSHSLIVQECPVTGGVEYGYKATR